MVVAHNLAAVNSNRQLSIVTGRVSKSAEKLSSGYKINRAADDAAGLSISEKMRKQIRGLGQATENCEDGISMVQTADGALNEVHDMLQRMNELCVQAANGTNALSDRLDIQKEIDQIKSEIDRVSETTKFNEINLLDGSIAKPGSTAEFLKAYNKRIAEVTKKYENDKAARYTALNGADAGKTVSAEDVAATKGLKIIYTKDDVVATQTPSGNPTATDVKYDNLKNKLQTEIVPNAVNALIDAYAPAYDFLKDSEIGMGLRLCGNADADMGSGTLAYVRLTHWSYSDDSVVPNELGYTLAVNVDKLGLAADGTFSESSRNALEVTIVHEMMHAFMDEALTNGMTGVVDGKHADDRFPKWFIEGMAQTAAGGFYNGNDFVNNMGINGSSSESSIENILNQYKIGGSDNRSNYGSGYLACMYLGYLKGGNSLTAADIKNGLAGILSDLRSGKSLQEEIKDIAGYTSLTDFQNKFAHDGASFVKALAQLVGSTGTGGVVGDLTIGDDILSNTVPTQNIHLFELNTSKEQVDNVYPGDYKVFAGGSSTNGKGVPTDILEPGDIAALKKSTGFGAAIQAGADADMNNKICVYIDAIDSESIGVSKVDVRTDDLATISIERVALAISKVSEQRSRLGAYQNRFEHTIKNLDNVVENTTAAESLIRDTDMAKEMVDYSNINVLQQAGQSMLTQANQMNQGVLSLLSA